MTVNSIKIIRSLLAFHIIVFGLNKFFSFLSTCSLLNDAPTAGIIGLGIIQIVLGIILFSGRYLLISAILATALMMNAVGMHLLKGTNDFGGAIVGGILGCLLIFGHKKLNQ